jgi:hypothetical protein
VCGTVVCDNVVCERVVCVCDKEEAAERRKEADGYRAEEQEPHTMMWGKGRKDDHEVGKVVMWRTRISPKEGSSIQGRTH